MFAPSGTSLSLIGNMASKSAKCWSSLVVASTHAFPYENVRASLCDIGSLDWRYLLLTLWLSASASWECIRGVCFMSRVWFISCVFDLSMRLVLSLVVTKGPHSYCMTSGFLLKLVVGLFYVSCRCHCHYQIPCQYKQFKCNSQLSLKRPLDHDHFLLLSFHFSFPTWFFDQRHFHNSHQECGLCPKLWYYLYLRKGWLLHDIHLLVLQRHMRIQLTWKWVQYLLLLKHCSYFEETWQCALC